MSNARRIMLLANNLLFWTRAEVARGATMAAARFGASIRCLDWYGSAAREKEYLASLLDSPPDGILFLCPFETKNLALCQELATRVPAVQIMVPHGDLCCDRVMMNNIAGASHAMDHLIRLGYRRIGHVTFNVDWPTVRERHQGFLNQMRAAGLPIEDEWVIELPGYMSPQDPIVRRPLFHEYLSHPNRPSAVFAYNDTLGLELVEAAWDLNINVPDDLSVIGFGNTPHALVGVPLTTIPKEFQCQGYLAAQQLIARLDGNQTPGDILMQPRLLIRESTRGASSDSERWHRVDRFVSERFRDNISMHDTARIAALEPHYFSKEFSRIYGTQFSRHLQQLRLEAARELLETTDQAVHNIAASCGFPSPNHFYKLFRRDYEMTPGQYRRIHRLHA